MTEEKQPDSENATPNEEAPANEAGTGTAVAEQGEEKKEKIDQTVDISDTGPCRKHIKVTIARPDIDKRFDEKYAELAVRALHTAFGLDAKPAG